MSVTHTHTYAWRTGTSSSKPANVPVTADTELNVDIAVAAGDADDAVTVAFAFAGLQSAFILSDADVILKTNSTGSPAQTFTLKAGKPLDWFKDSPLPNPFSVDVTSLHFGNAGAVVANVIAAFAVNNTA